MPRTGTIPKNVARGVVNMLSPYISDGVSEKLLEDFLKSLSARRVTLAEMASMAGVTKPAMLARLRKSDVSPVARGGRTGRESVYNFNEAARAAIQGRA